jgi:hypothetical protein
VKNPLLGSRLSPTLEILPSPSVRGRVGEGEIPDDVGISFASRLHISSKVGESAASAPSGSAYTF